MHTGKRSRQRNPVTTCLSLGYKYETRVYIEKEVGREDHIIKSRCGPVIIVSALVLQCEHMKC